MPELHSTPLGPTLVAAIMAFAMVAVFHGVRAREERQFLLPLALGSFLLKAMLVPAMFFLLDGGGYLGFIYEDGLKYHLSATEMSRDLVSGSARVGYGWNFRDPGYNYIGAALYALFGPNTLVPRYLNIAASAMTLLYVYRIARITFDEKVARLACWIIAFLPFTLLITIDQRKDAVVQFVAAFILYHTVRVLSGNTQITRSIVFVAIAMAAMYPLRSGFILPYIAVLGISFFLGRRSIVQGMAFSLVVVLALIAIQVVVPEDSGLSIANNVERFQGKVAQSEQLTAVGGLARLARVTSWTDLWKLPLGAFLVLILPFPPRFSGAYLPGTLLTWSNLPFLYFLPHIFVGALAAIRDDRWRLRLPLLIYPALFLVVLAVTDLSVTRYRETFLPALIILAAAGSRAGTGVVTRLVVYTGLGLLAVAVYVVRMS